MTETNSNQAKIDALREIAADDELMWSVGRWAIENALIEMRDSHMFVIRNNGLVVKNFDNSDSHIIRMGPEMAVVIALKAIADHLEQENVRQESSKDHMGSFEKYLTQKNESDE